MLMLGAAMACLMFWSAFVQAPAAGADRPTIPVLSPDVLSAGEVYRGAFTPDGAAPDVRYVANSGMLVTVSGRRFLIDAPIRDGISPYATSSAAERALLENARAPYDRVDAILITHWHEDHFDADAIAAHLRRRAAILISSPEVVDRVRSAAPELPASRLRAVLPPYGRSELVNDAGVPVHALRIRHNPARRLPEQHLGFLIGGSSPVLHVGDADPAADNFALLAPLPRIDLAFLPFWYVTGEANRTVVSHAIRPKRIVAMHVPPKDAAAVASQVAASGMAATVASTPATSLSLPR
jgi:L-ascorbate metabolism protein UlaG (beta-lactamase superfamily)